MATPVGKLATYPDLVHLSEDVRAQIVAGQIVTLPAPLPRHSKSQRALGRYIGGPFDDDDGFGGPGGWWIFVEVDVQLGPHDVVRPDLAGWRRDRLPRPGNIRPIEAAPDWVCEITSPSSAAFDRVTKRALYGKHHIPYYWIVDPEARTLEALQLRDGHWVEIGAWDDSAVVRVAPFAEVELNLGRIFLPRDVDPPSAG